MERSMLETLFSLRNKTALITGGYRGIGLLFAETYAEAGADVVLAARNREGCMSSAKALETKYGVKALGIAMDVNDTQTVDSAIEEVTGKFGTIDILVNSAGISGNQKPVMDMTDADLDEVMNVDFRGTFLVSRAVSREMIKSGRGKIINVASVLGKVAARYMSGYCCSKAAVISFTKVLALELLRHNIQVNALCPGYFVTEINRDFLSSEAGKGMIKKMVPTGRPGELEELKSTALYLATCPPFLTGSEIYIDGGQTLQ